MSAELFEVGPGLVRQDDAVAGGDVLPAVEIEKSGRTIHVIKLPHVKMRAKGVSLPHVSVRAW